MEAIEGGALQKLLVILATEQPLTAKKKVGFCSFPPAQPPAHLWARKALVPFQAVHGTLGGIGGQVSLTQSVTAAKVSGAWMQLHGVVLSPTPWRPALGLDSSPGRCRRCLALPVLSYGV